MRVIEFGRGTNRLVGLLVPQPVDAEIYIALPRPLGFASAWSRIGSCQEKVPPTSAPADIVSMGPARYLQLTERANRLIISELVLLF